MRLNLLSGGRPRASGLPQQSYQFLAESAAGQPGSFTGNANGQVLTTTDGTTFWYQEAKSGEIPFDGLRRVENELSDDRIDGFSVSNLATIDGDDFTFTDSASDFIFEQVAGIRRGESKGILLELSANVAGTIKFQLVGVSGAGGFIDQDIELTTTPTLYWAVFIEDGTGDGDVQYRIRNDAVTPIVVTVTVNKSMVCSIQDSNAPPEEFTQKTVTYNVKVAGVQCLATTNGNTDDVNGVVTLGAGSAITDGGYLPEPTAVNRLLHSNDMTNAIWFPSGAVVAADLGNTDIGGRTTRISGLGAVGVDDIVQSASGFTAAGPVAPSVLLRRNSTTGTLAIVSGAVGVPNGEWQVDLSLIGAGWVRLEPGANVAGFTEVTPWVADGGGFSGIRYFAAAGGPLTVDLSFNSDEDTFFATSPVVTTTVVVTRTASVLDTDVVIDSEFGVLLDLTLPLAIGAGNTISLLGPDATAEDVLRVNSGGDVIMDDGGTPVTIGTATLGTRIKVAYGRDATGRSASLDGAPYVTGDAPGAGHEGDTFQLGAANSVNQSRCIHHDSILYATRPTNGQLVDLSS